ncbi:MAG: hypothetical protein V4671_16140 [Armatimonadota bacterium]
MTRGIEATISRRIHTCEMRRSRYIGLGKVHPRQSLNGSRFELPAVGEWLSGMPIATTRKSPLARLMTLPTPA